MGRNAQLKEKQKWSHEGQGIPRNNQGMLAKIHHEDHVEGKGHNSLLILVPQAMKIPALQKGINSLRYVHKLIPMPQALKKNPAGEPAVDKERKKLEKIRRGT